VAEIINLRQARKNKARTQKAQQAAENRALHGRTKGDKSRHTAETEQARGHLDRAKLTDDE